MKRILVLLLCCLSISSFAASSHNVSTCGKALPTSNPNFCPSFKAIAACHCQEAGLPGKNCQSMSFIYGAMIARYRTVERACAAQHDTSFQECLDDWSCYRSGGRDSTGSMCSATGRACE
jgi:hypothetical protein